ncbi:MAG: tyrosine-type recombinase/integrase [Desulfobaccales bacterium]
MKKQSAYAITRDKFMSSDEAKKLMKVCRERGALDLLKGRSTWVTRYMLAHVALSSGLRVSEIAALKMEDLFLNGKENYLIVRKGKGDKKRDVYLDSELSKHLKDYIDLKKKTWREPVQKDSPFLAGRGGKHFTTTALEISFKKAIAEAGLPDHYSIHSARHTYATIMLAKTNNLRFVQKQLGHASLNMTALYADVLPEMNQDLANAILD